MKKTFLRKKTLSISKKTSKDEKDERNIYKTIASSADIKFPDPPELVYRLISF